MVEAAAANARPATNYIKLPKDGAPYLEGYKCGNCGSIFLGPRTTCSKCFARDKMSAVHLSNKGKVHVFSIVMRSFPGVKVPYISCVVDLDGGGTVKGNLIEVEPTPKAVEFGMPVEVVFGDAGTTDEKGNKYVAYFFRPTKAK